MHRLRSSLPLISLLALSPLALAGGAEAKNEVRKAEPAPEEKAADKTPAPAEAQAEALTTKTYKLALNFNELSTLGTPPPKPPQPPADPFAPVPAAADPFGADSPSQPPPDTSRQQEKAKGVVKTSRQILEEAGMTFPEGARAVYDPVTQEVTLHNTAAMHELAEVIFDSLKREMSRPTLSSTLTIVEGPGELIRQINADASRNADATPQMQDLLTRANSTPSQVGVVSRAFVESQSGTRATVEAVLERPLLTNTDDDDEEVPATTGPETSPPAPAATAAPPTIAAAEEDAEPETLWMRQDGLRLEIESTTGADGKTLDVIFNLELGPVKNLDTQEETEAPKTGVTPATLPPVSAKGGRRAQFTSSINFGTGSTKLIGITKPTGGNKVEAEADADTLWAVFLQGEARPLMRPPCAVAVRPEELPQGQKPAPGMRAVAFLVPEGLLESAIPHLYGFYAPWDKPQTLLEWLGKQGVAFPEGSSIAHRDGRLHVVNTPENIELYAALVEHAWAQAGTARSVALTLHTYEVSAEVLHEFRQQNTPPTAADDAAMLAAVEKATASGKASHLDSTFFEAAPDQRARQECGLRHSHLAVFETDAASGKTGLTFEQNPMGSLLEIEPTVNEDGRTLSLIYSHELHPAPPAGHRQAVRGGPSQKYHDLPVTDVKSLRTTSGIRLASGGTKLISMQRPANMEHGRLKADPFGSPPEPLWLTFLQAHVVPQVRKPQTQPKPPPPTPEEAATQKIIEKMNKIILPEVTLKEATLQQAIDFLRAKSLELDTFTEAGGEKGVKFILPADDFPIDTSITLDLKDVPFSEALRYVSELAQKKYTVRAHGVLVAHVHYDGDGQSLLHTRVFRVPQDFLALGENPASTADFSTPADPFAIPPAEGPKVRKTAKQILEAQGITFPEGSSATFIPATSRLVVRNSQPNLDIVEAFVEMGCYVRQNTTLAITAQVLQGPGPLLRRIAAQAAPLNDHRAQLAELLAAVKAGSVQALDTARIETKSGAKGTAEQGRDLRHLTWITLRDKAEGKDGGTTAPAHLQRETLFTGLRLEAEPVLNPDGNTINLALAAEFHTAPPHIHAEHLTDADGRRLSFPLTDTYLAKLQTHVNLPDGHTRLLHLWKPTGKPEFEKEDVLQVMFITCDILRQPVE